MRKTFIITMFGEPFSWIQQYIDHVQHLEVDGWFWKIITPHDIKSKGNVEVVNMTIEQFNDLVETKTGVRSGLYINSKGKPSAHITDFYIFSGVIFEDYLKDSDFWGVTNMDVVYGNMSKFITDMMLHQCDIFSDDVNTINGVFSLWRNTPIVNTLYKSIPHWKDILSYPRCIGCETGDIDSHFLYGSDEILMTNVVRKANYIRFLYPTHYPMLSHDRLEQHVPTPKLSMKDNGALYELFRDTLDNSQYEHARPFIGREIYLFHFSRTKKWPL